ncbi:hypothetical protein TrVFT333_006427 [Trichoderma virens FT-333]|nr:hypothetical protein TrVFT333_006427 [Trichoderma virens FT-333]
MLPRFSANASPDGMDVDSQQDKGDNSAEASAAEGNSAEGNNVEGNSAEGNNAERNGAKGKSAEGNNMEGNSAEGNNAERNGAEGNDAEGRGAEGNNAERNGAEGNGPMGKSAEGNNTEGSNSNNEDEGMFMPLDTDVEYGYNTEQEDEGVFMTDHVDDVFVIGETILHSPRNAEGEAVGYLKGRGGTLFIVHKHTIRLPNGTIAASKWQKYSKEYDQGGVLEGSVEPEPELKKYLNSLD